MFYINGLNVEQQNFDNVSTDLLLFEITHGIPALNYKKDSNLKRLSYSLI